MKTLSWIICVALSVVCPASSYATTLITCVVPAQSPAYSEAEAQDRVFQITHFDDGHVSGGLASTGPIGVEKVQEDYRYTFEVTRSWSRQYGNDCGTSDSEANEGSIWGMLTYAPRDRERATYSLTVSMSHPSQSKLTTSLKRDCYGGLSFLGSQGHWSLKRNTEESAECVLRATPRSDNRPDSPL
jgi:hypothetical protein